MGVEFTQELETRLALKQCVELALSVIVIALVVVAHLDSVFPRADQVPHDIPAVPDLPEQPDSGLVSGPEDDTPNFRVNIARQN